MALPHRPAEQAPAQDVRRHIIDTITEYYRFLTRLPHINPENLVFPPESDGWQTIKDAELKARGLSDEAIDLLRHLPYLRNSGLPDRTKNNITHDSLSVAYCDGELPPHQHQPTPGHVIWLTTQSSKDGSFLFLDINAGTITTFNPLHPGPPMPDSFEYGELDEADEWMNYPTLPVADFFERCRRMYERLVWIPVPGLKIGGEKGNAHHFERILNRGFQDYYLLDDEGYHDEDGESDAEEEDDDADGDIPEEEIDQLMEDAGPDIAQSAEIHETSKPTQPRPQRSPIVEDEYQTDVPYEEVEPRFQQMWLEAKETYFIYKNNDWPEDSFDKAKCTQQLHEWLEAKNQRI